MKICFVASEVDPFIKTGGLADVMYALPRSLKEMVKDIIVILPKYSKINEMHSKNFKFIKHFYINMNSVEQYVGLYSYQMDSITYYFIDNEYYFARDDIYGFFDDGERFSFFSRAVLEVLENIKYYPDILHLNDWHSASIAPVFKQKYKIREHFKNTKVIYTIHNLKYQGIFPKEILTKYLALDEKHFSYDKMEHFSNINFMKAGINYADKVTTVSETYANELSYSYFSEGLSSLLHYKAKDIVGILNGIDYDLYNPKKDKDIYKKFDIKKLRDKTFNKTSLQKDLGLKVSKDTPMISIITRLVSDKGVDLLSFIFDELMNEDIQFVVLGSGDKEYENKFLNYCKKYPKRVSANIFFSAKLAKKIYAASDIFLMPSRYEPCGLGQMIAMRYLTIPIVRETGGLKDTVIPYNQFTQKGNGFSFKNYNAHELLFTIKDALSYYKDKNVWKRIQKQADLSNNSWKNSARKYLELYNEVLGKNI